MNLLFIGSTALSWRVLETLHQIEDVQVVGCITAPQEFTISYSTTPVSNVLHRDMRPLCATLGIPVRSTRDGFKDPNLLEWALSRAADAAIVVGWHHMVPARWLRQLPAYGVHASLLPDLAGGAPLVWALILGREVTGATMFQFDEGVDSGPVLGQVTFPIEPEDDISDLLTKAEISILALVEEQVRLLRYGKATLTPQDPVSRVVMPQRSPKDGRINWNQSSLWLRRFVRAQTRPYPGAFSTVLGQAVRFYGLSPRGYDPVAGESTGATLDRLGDASPGTYLVGLDDIFVKCGDGVLVAHSDQFEWPEGLPRPPMGLLGRFDP